MKFKKSWLLLGMFLVGCSQIEDEAPMAPTVELPSETPAENFQTPEEAVEEALSPEDLLPQAQRPDTYLVAEGDTWASIAETFGLSVEELRVWNMVSPWRMEQSDRPSVGYEISITGISMEELDQVTEDVRQYLFASDSGWSQRFFVNTDVKVAYLAYLWTFEHGIEDAPSIAGFADFLTYDSEGVFAFSASNWKELAIIELEEVSGLTVSRLQMGESIGWEQNLYIAYAIDDGGEEFAFATINPRTGEITWDFKWQPNNF